MSAELLDTLGRTLAYLARRTRELADGGPLPDDWQECWRFTCSIPDTVLDSFIDDDGVAAWSLLTELIAELDCWTARLATQNEQAD
jgi:hypothetical protein